MDEYARIRRLEKAMHVATRRIDGLPIGGTRLEVISSLADRPIRPTDLSIQVFLCDVICGHGSRMWDGLAQPPQLQDS